MNFANSLSAYLATKMKLALVRARHKTRRRMPAPLPIKAGVAVFGAALWFAVTSAAQETSSNTGSQPAAATASPVESEINTPNSIMGFENLGDWNVSTNTLDPKLNVQLTTVRTQGNAAYSISNPPSLFQLVSLPVASSATALAGAGNEGAALQLDVLVPCGSGVSTLSENGTCSSVNDGSIEGFVSSRSLGLKNVSLGKVSFKKYRPGIYNTVSFEIPESLGSALDHAEFNDLIFGFDVSSPSVAQGTYLFDNLRVHSVELVQSPKGIAPPAGYGGSVDLTVTGNKPVKQSFHLDPIQIPSGLHLKKGTAGATSVQLEAGLDSQTVFTCTYIADTSDESGQSYKLDSCTGGYQGGDLVSSDWVSLAIEGGETSQQIYAQLALRPLGDLTGSDLLAPMPTFWGNADTCSPAPVQGKVVTTSTSCSNQTAQANSIITNYFNQVNSTHPSPSWIVAPVPESAIRRGDETPANHLSGAATADAAPDASNDLPFDTGGDLNPGGSFDAYWKLSGNLTPTAVAGTDENLTHFDAAFTAHGVLFGDDIDVVDAKLTADTDSGETTPTYKPATSSGTLGFYVFGEEIPSGGLSFSPSTGFNIDPSWNQEYDLPSIQIWIFDITLGALVDADLKAEGSAALSGADLSITPSASLGAHISGGIDLDVVQGDVDAKVNLITLSAPVTAQAKWVLNDDPSICAAELDGSLDGNLNVSSGGGDVDLDATFGICPFCYTDSWTLFKWGALASKSWNLFSDTIDTQLFGLPASMCKFSINASIVSPAAGATLSSGLPITLTGSAAPTESSLAYTSTYTWTFTPGANAAGTVTVVGANSANPTVTFPPPTSGNTSTWTINMTATTTVRSAGGAVLTQTASAAPVTITVTSLSPGDHFSVSTEYNPVLPDGPVLNVGNAPGTITFSGIVADAPGTPTTTFTVAPCDYVVFHGRGTCIVNLLDPGTITTLPTVGANTATPSASWSGFEGGYYWVTMTTTIGNSTFSTVTAIIYGTEII